MKMSIKSILESFNRFMTKCARKLGYTVGLYPGYFVLVPFFLSLIGHMSSRHSETLTNPYILFTPEHGESRQDMNSMMKLFPQNYSRFYPSTMIQNRGGLLWVLATSKDNRSVLRMEAWKEIMEMDQMLMNLTIEYDSEFFQYKDICAENHGKCFRDQVFALDEIMPELDNGSIQINYPVMLHPRITAHSFGNVVLGDEEGYIVSAGSIRFQYYLKLGNNAQRERAAIWEKEAFKRLMEQENEHIVILAINGLTIEEELHENEAIGLPYLYVSIAIMLIFTCVSLGNTDWVRSKYYLGFVGVACSMLSIAASSGFLIALGHQTTVVHMVIPFLILGIGLDDQYVLLSGWHRTKMTDSVPERLAEAYSEAAISVTITSLTNALSFIVGSSSSIPVISSFCLFAGVNMIFTYFWFLFFFGGCMAFAGRAEAANKHSLTLKVVQPKSLSKNESSFYRYWCAAGINRDDANNPEDNTNHHIIQKWKETLTNFVTNPIAKGVTLVFYIAFFAGAVYGVTKMEKGIDHARYLPENSHFVDFAEAQNQFTHYSLRIQIIIDEPLKYSDPEIQERFQEYHSLYEDSEYFERKLFTTSYLRQFYAYLKRRPALRNNITSEADFIRILREKFFVRNSDAVRDFVFDANFTKILAYRFILQAKGITGGTEEGTLITVSRDMASSAPFKSFAYNMMYPLADQFLYILEITVRTIAYATICMIFVAFLFMPQILSCCAIIFSIVSMELGIIGYLSLWGALLDPITVGNLIMCIGFSVDFSAHISYAYITSKAKSNRDKIYEAIDKLGIPVIQGGVSTFLAASTMIFCPSYVFKLFFMTILLVISLGIIHALILLPMIFSVLGLSSSSVDERIPVEDSRRSNGIEMPSNGTVPSSLKENGTAHPGKENGSHSNGIENAGYKEEESSQMNDDSLSCKL